MADVFRFRWLFTSLNNAALAEYLGTQGYGLIISLCSFGYGISSLVTTYLFKRLSFSGALSAAAAAAMIGLTLAVLLPKLKKVTAGSLAAAGAEKR